MKSHSDTAPAPAAGDGDIVADLRAWAKVCEGVGGISRCEVLLRAATAITELRRDLRRYENARAVLVAENERLRSRERVLDEVIVFLISSLAFHGGVAATSAINKARRRIKQQTIPPPPEEVTK